MIKRVNVHPKMSAKAQVKCASWNLKGRRRKNAETSACPAGGMQLFAIYDRCQSCNQCIDAPSRIVDSISRIGVFRTKQKHDKKSNLRNYKRELEKSSELKLLHKLLFASHERTLSPKNIEENNREKQESKVKQQITQQKQKKIANQTNTRQLSTKL